VSRKRKFIATSASTLVALSTVGAAQGAAPLAPATGGVEGGEIAVLDRPAQRFERNLELGALRLRYAALLQDARELDAAPEAHLLDERVAKGPELREGIADLRDRVEKAEEAAETGVPSGAVSGGTVAGVPLSTLNAIAACESGGDPTAVNPAGYYGKYQFDMGTWASVGGSGNPAAASEEEQDYRAALLYSQAGSSPWPVCGL
jgi:soluble lytic murein transglycosylase-like protein